MTTDPSPKIPLWVFVVSDVALLATAWLIAENSRHPLSPAAVSAVAACAALGTLAYRTGDGEVVLAGTAPTSPEGPRGA